VRLPGVPAMPTILLFCLATFVAQNSASSADETFRTTIVQSLGNEGNGLPNR